MKQYFTNKEESMLLQDLGIKGETLMVWACIGSKEENVAPEFAYREFLVPVNTSFTIIAPAFLMAQLYSGFSPIHSRVFKNEVNARPDKISMEQVIDFLVDMLDTQLAVEKFNERMNLIEQ